MTLIRPATLLSATFAAATLALTMNVSAQDLVGDCDELPAHLEACKPFECTFTHPFTGEEETRMEPASSAVTEPVGWRYEAAGSA